MVLGSVLQLAPLLWATKTLLFPSRLLARYAGNGSEAPLGCPAWGHHLTTHATLTRDNKASRAYEVPAPHLALARSD